MVFLFKRPLDAASPVWASLGFLLALGFSTATARASSVYGTVLDPQGRPVPEARVTLLSPLGNVAERTTDAQGDYRFDGLPRGEYRLTAQARGFSNTPLDVAISGGRDQQVDLHLQLSAVAEQVVVSASQGGALAPQVGSSVSVLTAQQMQDRGDQTIFDALRAVPGVSVAESGARGSVTSLFVRGGESDYNLVEMDGIPLNEFGGAFDFAPLTTDGVDHVEVTRSPESALYGTNAVSSVVDIVTRSGDGPPHLSLTEEAGSFDTWRTGVGASGLTRGLGWAVDASRLDSGGPVPNSSYQDQSAIVSLTYPSDGRRQFTFHFFGNANDAGAPGAYGSDPDHLFTGIDRYSRDKQNLFAYAFSYTEQFSPRFRQVTTVDASTNDYYFRSTYGDSYSNNLRGAFNTRSEVLLSNRDFLVGGFEYDREQIEDTYIANAVNNPFVLPRNTLAYFFENRWTPASRWSVTAGVRADDIHTGALPENQTDGRPAIPFNTLLQVDPHLSLAWVPHAGHSTSPGLGATRLHASFGTGIREPSGFELAFTNNPQLKPERSLSFDAGVDQRFWGEHAAASATYFYTRLTDEIEVLGGSLSNLSTYLTANLGNARAQGLELSLRLQPKSGVRFEAGYTFMPTEILALAGSNQALSPFSVGQPLIRRPDNSGFYTMSWTHRRLTVVNSGYWRGQVLDLEPNEGTYACELGLPCLFQNKGNLRLDGGFSFRADKGLEIYGQIYNLLDRRYEEVLGFPALPLNFLAGIRFNFPKE
ncbi:MAG TPA: TonB-dependent receptor [Terriglobia bacterium]|nr:TonB-dependent receptor [Terriglobia bacterium]